MTGILRRSHQAMRPHSRRYMVPADEHTPLPPHCHIQPIRVAGDILLIILGILCLIVGLAGCILPMIPGPPVAYAGLLLLHFTDKAQFSTTQLLLWLAAVVLVQILDYFVPMLGSKYSGGSRWGTRGCLIGTIVGLFFMPWGIILGPFLGAFAGELMGGSKTDQALKSGLGSLLGFLLGTVVKCVMCAYFCWEFVKALV